ncbi:unnamed protein product [Aspergillus oryzae var. brunneus]|uniref:Unnamed protein product n=2 Tax=Aspergillus oryzae TaxID=5062 RepID=A0AAN4YMC0_ASPOZ|nr:unnamed protein product [Aspergillus oryzae]GMG43541.1 unnamed protein product [Aspergillus oryzae var. brunneus]
MIQFQRTIFAECGPRVGSHDWEVIMAFDSKSSDMNTLRLILYPTTGDIKNGDLVRKYLRLDSKWFSIRALPQLESPRVLGSKPFSTRGPGSLAQLSDIGFHACFDSLAGIPSLKCPTWSNLGLEAFDSWGTLAANIKYSESISVREFALSIRSSTDQISSKRLICSALYGNTALLRKRMMRILEVRFHRERIEQGSGRTPVCRDDFTRGGIEADVDRVKEPLGHLAIGLDQW